MFNHLIVLLFIGATTTFGAQILCAHRGPENVDSKGIMETHISLMDNGTMIGSTTLSTKKRKGFTGGIGIAFFTEDQKQLWHGKIHNFNVRKNKPLTEEWIEKVPKAILPDIKRIAIVQKLPSNKFWNEANKISQVVWNAIHNDKY